MIERSRDLIRPYRPSDLPALRRICLLTGNDGTDATGQYSDDGLLPDAFLEPYVTLVPETCWVVELDGRPVGYLVAALDTEGFLQRWRAEWAPVFRARHPGREAGAEWVYDVGDGAEPGYWAQVRRSHPAHLHIDLLPEAQGQGSGRALMRQLGLAAVAADVPGIHLAMSPENLPARAFYTRLGFEQLDVTGEALILGIDAHRLAA